MRKFKFWENGHASIETAYNWRNILGLKFSLGNSEDRQIGTSLTVLGFTLWLSLENRLTVALTKLFENHLRDPEWKSIGRTIGFHLSTECLNWELWWYNGVNSTGNKARSGYFWFRNIVDFWFGRRTSEEFVVSMNERLVLMPEKEYKCTVVISDVHLARPRLPLFVKKFQRIKIDLPEGLPVPGKGTASYNCGDDATFGITQSYDKENGIRYYLNKLAIRTLEIRQDRANINWLPKPKKKVGYKGLPEDLQVLDEKNTEPTDKEIVTVQKG